MYEGAGNHSDKKKGPVIKPAIIKMCSDNGWNINQDCEGAFTVTF
jgi:hypothetical protein